MNAFKINFRLKLILVHKKNEINETSDSSFKSFPGFYFIFCFEKEMHFEGGKRGFSWSFEAAIASAFVSCYAVQWSVPLSSHLFPDTLAILLLQVFFGHVFARLMIHFYCFES